MLASHANAGITKKKNNKILKRKQKQRIEQGREKAEAVIEKLERKVERAVGGRERKKGRNVSFCFGKGGVEYTGLTNRGGCGRLIGIS